ncbi:hypothetical protein ACFL16_00225 [Patescibacteria group bacterium]
MTIRLEYVRITSKLQASSSFLIFFFRGGVGVRRTNLSIAGYLLLLMAAVSVAILCDLYGFGNTGSSVKEIAQKTLIGGKLTEKERRIIAKNRDLYDEQQEKILRKVARKIKFKHNLDGREFVIYFNNKSKIDGIIQERVNNS